MAYTRANFDSQVETFISAINSRDILAAATALVTMDAMLASIAFNVESEDAGSSMKRRDSLRGMWQNAFGDRSYYDVYSESTGTSAEVMMPQPGGIDAGMPGPVSTC